MQSRAALSGHSLLAMQVIARLEKQLGLRLDPKEFIFQTVGQIISLCAERMSGPPELPSSSLAQKVWNRIKSVIFRRKAPLVPENTRNNRGEKP